MGSRPSKIPVPVFSAAALTALFATSLILALHLPIVGVRVAD
jgi:hypothetical protein